MKKKENIITEDNEGDVEKDLQENKHENGDKKDQIEINEDSKKDKTVKEKPKIEIIEKEEPKKKEDIYNIETINKYKENAKTDKLEKEEPKIEKEESIIVK